MNLFRRLTADMPGELLVAQVATTSRQPEPATAPDPWIPGDLYHELFTILAALADNPGVLSPDTPGLPAPAQP